jgi:superfamily II DNA or RNA helicase
MENNSPILPVEVVVKKSTVKFRPQVTEGNVYNILDNAIMADRQFANLVMSDIIREAKQGHSCVVFLSQKKHCLSFYNELVSCLGNTVQLYYGDSKESDEVILSRAESKESLVTITTYSKGTEGTNCKSWEVAFLVSSLNSAKNTEQAVGRIRRAKEGKLNPVRVYDYRHPDVHIIKYHGFNRDARYSKLGFRINRSFDTING